MSFRFRVRKRRLILLLCLAPLVVPTTASACSSDSSTYLETFIDAQCLAPGSVNAAIDALGGLRLTTNGAPASVSWDTDVDFANGITYQSVLFPPVGVSTLATTGVGTGATLATPTTQLPLAADATGVVLPPTASTALDGDDVADPSVIRGGSGYVMYYTGVPEDGGASAILRATSADGITWTRPVTNATSLLASFGEFDQNGVAAPSVAYDAADPAAPYRMWYAGTSGPFTSIGYATSLDGVAWQKHTDAGGHPAPVLTHGPGGSADSFGVDDPSVLHDGAVWKMWYSGDDSSKKRVAYATSPDGVTWSKGGKVIAPEDPGASANLAYGAYAPTVYKVGATYEMLLVGRKIVGGTTFQTKILGASSSDGIAWSGPSPSINPSGSNANFDFSNLDGPTVLAEPSGGFIAWYAGNTLDANGNSHTRIGLANSSNGTSFAKVAGGAASGAVLDIGTAGTSFDSRSAAGLDVLAPAAATPSLVGFYSGTRGSDFIPRIGEATSSDASTWTKLAGTATGGALLPLGSGAAFDAGGQADPSALYESGTYHLFFTGVSNAGSDTIGVTTTTETPAHLPLQAGWTARTQVLGLGSGFDGAGVSTPCAIRDGANVLVYYTGTDAAGLQTIGRASSASLSFTAPTRAQVLVTGAAGSFDADGVRNPVVVKLAATDFRMLYTGIESLNGTTVERIGLATSSDGISWTKQGVVLNPSLSPFASDELGVEPSGMLLAGGTLHIFASGRDRNGRPQALHATSAFPSASGKVPSGFATFQLGNSTTTAQDFRSISRVSTGPAEVWMSFLQPYSTTDWSDYFPVTRNSPTELLNLLLTVKAVRIQARLPAAATLDSLSLTHADVSYSPTGSAATTEIAPPDGRGLRAWQQLSVHAASGGSGGTVTVIDAATSAQLASAALVTGGATTIDLRSISAAQHPALRVVFTLTSLGSTSPLVQSLTITYGLAALPPLAPPAPPPPPADTTPPIGAAVAALRPFARSLAPLKLAFTALDPETGVARYAVLLRVGKSGTALPAATLWKSGLTTPGAAYTGAAGTTACFSVVATNGQGLASAASAPSCTTFPTRARSLKRIGPWKAIKTKLAYGGGLVVAKAHKALLVRKGIKTKRIALLVTRCKTCGTVRVYLGTKLLRTIRLRSTSTRHSVLVIVKTFTTPKTGTLRLVVSSTGKPVPIEGLGLSLL